MHFRAIRRVARRADGPISPPSNEQPASASRSEAENMNGTKLCKLAKKGVDGPEGLPYKPLHSSGDGLNEPVFVLRLF